MISAVDDDKDSEKNVQNEKDFISKTTKVEMTENEHDTDENSDNNVS